MVKGSGGNRFEKAQNDLDNIAAQIARLQQRQKEAEQARNGMLTDDVFDVFPEILSGDFEEDTLKEYLSNIRRDAEAYRALQADDTDTSDEDVQLSSVSNKIEL